MRSPSHCFAPRSVLLLSIASSSLAVAAPAGPTPISAARAPSPASAASVVRAPASAGQAELAVGFDSHGALRAAVCTVANCSIENGTQMSFPAALAAKRSQAKLSVIPIGERRNAIHVAIAGERSHEAWQAVIVSKPGSPSPEVVFQGMTGYLEGEEGLRRGPTLQISEPIDGTGTRRVLLGEQREDLTLCGRPAVLAPKMLTAKDLLLKPAKVQRLSVAERERAAKLIAEARTSPLATGTNSNTSTAVAATNSNTSTAVAATNSNTSSAVAATNSNTSTAVAATNQPPHASSAASEAASTTASPITNGGQASLLQAIGATSAIGWPASLTDGNTETTWAENRGGAGRGEFVSFHAPSDVPLQSFEFVVRPQKREIKHGVGPETLWLVTDQLAYAVVFPTDPWKAPGITWSVALPAPVKTSCVALVTESAFGEKPDSEVTLAEVHARSEFTTASIENLVGALAGGGPRADAAGTVLAGLGAEAIAAVAKAFDNLDEGGRRVALDVLDHASCSDSSPIYIKALLGKTEAHRLHALDRLRRCGAAATPAIEAAIATLPASKIRALAELLAEVAPDRALRLLVPRLTGPQRTRRMLREVIGQAARSPKSAPVITELLNRTDLPTEAAVDLLRALGKQLPDYADSATATIQRILQPTADFRTKYLVIAPAHLVSNGQSALAQQLSQLMRSEPSAPLRTEAVRATVHLDTFAADLYSALQDPDVRVRQAAAQSLAGHQKAETVHALSQRLKQDTWPLVRVAAAESLAAQARGDVADRALVEALEDPSWQVKSAAADAIGARKASLAGEPLLELFNNRKERYEVRVAAARALGEICYDGALDDLTDAAKKLRSPSPDPQDRAVAASALGALARLRPRDLASRLAPLLSGKDTPMGTKEAAKAALNTEPHCHMTSALKTASIGAQQ